MVLQSHHILAGTPLLVTLEESSGIEEERSEEGKIRRGERGKKKELKKRDEKGFKGEEEGRRREEREVGI